MGLELIKQRELIRLPDWAGIEQRAWREPMGADIEVKKPLPSYVTPDAVERLSELGFRKIIYIPGPGFSEVDLRSMGVSRTVEELEKLFPNLKLIKGKNPKQKADHKDPRYLEKWFWGEISQDRIAFPNSRGTWLAVDDTPMPKKGEKYEKAIYIDMLGFGDDRFGKNESEISDRINDKEKAILRYAGLPQSSVDLRFPKAWELALLSNREGWLKPEIWEWTNSPYLTNGYSSLSRYKVSDGEDLFTPFFRFWDLDKGQALRLISGHSLISQTGLITPVNPHNSDKQLGFRCVLEFREPERGRLQYLASNPNEDFVNCCTNLGLRVEDLAGRSEGNIAEIIRDQRSFLIKKCHTDIHPEMASIKSAIINASYDRLIKGF